MKAVVLVAVVLAGGSAWYFKNRSSQRARFEAESAEARAAGLRAAFQGSGQPVSLTSPEAKAIDAVFVRMKKAYDKKDAGALADCFDFAGVIEMAADQNPTAELKSTARRARRDSKGAKEGAVSAVQGLVRNADHLSYEIRRLELDAAGNPAGGFTPDFYLPAQDLYIEITTLNQKLRAAEGSLILSFSHSLSLSLCVCLSLSLSLSLVTTPCVGQAQPWTDAEATPATRTS